jgi:RNA polymerase sigma factor (sigma-70 family)
MKPLDTLTDEQLALQIQQGSEAHFNVLVDRYARIIFRIAHGITGRPEEAEDIVQETFFKVFHNINRFSPSKGSLKTWLVTIARNQSINVYSSLRRNVLKLFDESEADYHDAGSGDNPTFSPPQDLEDLFAAKQQLRRVSKSLARLPERQRTALLLKVQEEMSYEEIASILKTSVSSVESLIFRARKKLLETLEE